MNKKNTHAKIRLSLIILVSDIQPNSVTTYVTSAEHVGANLREIVQRYHAAQIERFAIAHQMRPESGDKVHVERHQAGNGDRRSEERILFDARIFVLVEQKIVSVVQIAED